MQDIIYNADLYLRLSKEDGDKVESDSISNQRDLLLDFLRTQTDINLHKIRIDDGYTGVDFMRPAFSDMIDDIKAGVVNCIIVKDFSRFGRNYIESGKYIQIMFPRTGVRFIAVNDNYDSTKVQGYTGNVIVPFKNMLNDTYSADISVKVRSHLNMKRKKGEFVGAFAVYGYSKDDKNKNQLVIDPFAADVVCDIYRWKIEGISSQGIANRLNQNGILSPSEYKRYCGLRYKTTFKVKATAVWQSATVKRVLTNAIYTGLLEQGKRSKPNYKVRKCVELPKDQWIRTENTHQAIIERGIFDTVQSLLKQDTRAAKVGSAVFPLSGVIVCGDCGAAMVRKTYAQKGDPRYSYYVCSKHRSDKNACSTHTVSVNACEKAVLNALRLHSSAVLDMEKALNCAESMAYTTENVRKLTARIEAKQDEINKYKEYRLSLHESYQDGVITKDDFINFKKTYDEKITDAEAAVLSMKEDIELLAAGETESQNWINEFRVCSGVKVLERRAVVELIERVNVYENSRIEIIFRYQNEFNRLSESLKAVA
jgi:DNA invertase Pin-like site-specific DNA recombinase